MVRVLVGYEHPPREVQRLLVGALEGAEGVAREPAPDCVLTEFGQDGITYAAVRYWIDEVARDTRIDSEVRSRIWYALQGAGIRHPRPAA